MKKLSNVDPNLSSKGVETSLSATLEESIEWEGDEGAAPLHLDESAEWQEEDAEEGEEPPRHTTASMVGRVAVGALTGVATSGINLPQNIIAAKAFTDAAPAELLKFLMQLLGISEIKQDVLDEITTYLVGENSWNSEDEMKSVLGRKNPEALKKLGYEEGGVIQVGGSGLAKEESPQRRPEAHLEGMESEPAATEPAATEPAPAPELSKEAKKVLLLFVFMLMCTFTIWGADLGGFSNVFVELGRSVGKGVGKIGAYLPVLSSLIESIVYIWSSNKDSFPVRLRNVVIKSGSMLVAGFLMIGIYPLINFVPGLLGIDVSGHVIFFTMGAEFAASSRADLRELWETEEPEGRRKVLINIFLVIFLFVLCVGILTTTVGKKPSGAAYHTVCEVIAGMLSGTAYVVAFNAMVEQGRAKWKDLRAPGGEPDPEPKPDASVEAAAAKGGGRYKNSKRRTRKRRTRKRRTRKRRTRKRRKTSVKKTRKRKYSSKR